MKSRFYYADGLLVDVSEIVAMQCKPKSNQIILRNGHVLSVSSKITMNHIDQHTINYEREMQAQWDRTLAFDPAPDDDPAPSRKEPVGEKSDWEKERDGEPTGAKKPTWQQEEIDRINQAQDGGKTG